MVSPAWQGLAIKWSYFFFISSLLAFQEYLPLYLKQLGFTASQVGLSTLMGIPLLFAPLFGFLGDRFRARKLVLVTLLLLLILILLAPLLPLVSPLGKCNNISNASLTEVNQPKQHLHASIYIENITDDFRERFKNNLNPSKYFVRSLPNSNSTQIQREQTTDVLKKNASNIPWSSFLFIYIAIIRGLYEVLKRATASFYNVTTMTYLERLEDRETKYGSYYCWGYIGASLSLFIVGIMASRIGQTFCGNIEPGYFVIFFYSSFGMSLTLIALPWISYEYLDNRVVNWSDVRGVICNGHHLVVLFVGIYLGYCCSFQQYWEYWYIAELSGSPVIMGVGGLIRQPFAAFWYYFSGRILDKVGELHTMAVALFAGAVSLLTLSFVQTPWLVLFIDVFLSGTMALSYAATILYFSKCTSKASSAVILGAH